MPRSDDPAKRAAQDANLPNLRGEPTATTWRPGAAPHLKHGLRSRRPDRVLLGAVFAEIVDALEGQVPIRDETGAMRPEFTTAVEAAALQMVIVKRVLGYLTTHGWEDANGRLRPEVAGLERANDRLTAHLERLGATPTSYARLGLDVARGASLAEQMAREGDGADG